jgi:hypothetical protein
MTPTHDHDNSIPCRVCDSIDDGKTQEQALAKYSAWAERCLKEHGWYAHFVPNDDASPTGCNAHTHGIAEHFGHPDLQIVLPVPAQAANGIMTNIVERIKKGERFSHGDVLEGVIQNGYLVKLVSASEGGRDVLRVILPDVAGELDADRQSHHFALQYADLAADT